MRVLRIADENLAKNETTAPRARFTSWIAVVLLVVITLGIATFVSVNSLTADAPTPEQAGQQEAKPGIFPFVAKSLGVIFGPLLLLDLIALVALVVLLSMDLRVTVAIPAKFVEEFTDLVNRRRFKDAFDLARKDPSFLARVLLGGMGRLQYGLEEARIAASATSTGMQACKGHVNDYQKIIALVSPMIGLLATLCGVIVTLTNAPQAVLNLSAAIGQCLVPTAVGIVLSLAATISYMVCKNRIACITMDVHNIADDLLTQMYHNSKGKGGLASGWN